MGRNRGDTVHAQEKRGRELLHPFLYSGPSQGGPAASLSPPAGLAPGAAGVCPALGAAPGPESPAAVRADLVSLMAPQCCLPWLRPQAPEASGDDRSLLPTGPGAGKLVTGLAPFSPSLPRVDMGLSSHLHGASPRQDGSYPGPLLFLISHPPRKAGGNYGFSFPGHTPVSSSIILHK